MDDVMQFEGVWYRWSCVSCGEMNEDENDMRGDEVECDVCGAKGVVEGQ